MVLQQDASCSTATRAECTLRSFRSLHSDSNSLDRTRTSTTTSSKKRHDTPTSTASSSSSSSPLTEHAVAVKSKFGVEFRRFILCAVGGGRPPLTFDEFQEKIHDAHKLTSDQRTSTLLTYISADGTILPLNNDENVRKALLSPESAKLLRVVVRNKGESRDEEFGYGVQRVTSKRKKISISAPQDFRTVSSILDVDSLPGELRRVRLCKFYNNKPLGFFIRDGPSHRPNPWGYGPGHFSASPRGIFISRLLPHGLAASTNLLHVDDEILEVNGIDVTGKTLDQVTDIMIANSANLILTVRVAPSPPLWSRMPPPCPPYGPVPPSYGFPHFYPIPPGYGPPPAMIPAPGYAQFLPSSFYPPPPLHPTPAHYGTENLPDVERCQISDGAFSRESTWRVSDEATPFVKRWSFKSRWPPSSSPSSTAARRRRPFSMHSPSNVVGHPMHHQLPPYLHPIHSPPYYGY